MTISRATSRHARSLRRDMTDAERQVWQALRNRKLRDFKFRRQWTLGPYIVDFFCCETGLVVEIDGGQHSEEADRARTEWLKAQGYHVLRFWNSDVMGNLEGVLQVIAQDLENHPHPNHQGSRFASQANLKVALIPPAGEGA